MRSNCRYKQIELTQQPTFKLFTCEVGSSTNVSEATIWMLSFSSSFRKWAIIYDQKLILQTLGVISIKFLLVIAMLCKTEWSRELRTWSHKTYLLDILSTSPHYFYIKWIGATNENDLRVFIPLRPHPHESGYFWNCIFFLRIGRSFGAKSVNLLTKMTYFRNHRRIV